MFMFSMLYVFFLEYVWECCSLRKYVTKIGINFHKEEKQLIFLDKNRYICTVNA